MVDADAVALAAPVRAVPIAARPRDEALRFPRLHERAGPYEIRLVEGDADLAHTQRLRFAVFFEEGGAIASGQSARQRLDLCPFDAICDHLVVIDHGAGGDETVGAAQSVEGRVVGTYRLLRREVAERHGGFYSQGEFDLGSLLARHPDTRFLELGRSCVHAAYRSRRVIELLWRGLYLYTRMHAVDALIGCASLPGTDLDALRLPLSFLLRHLQADERWQVSALPHRDAGFVPASAGVIDGRRALAALPPLIKAYLRTGARFGRDVVLDRQFGTADVFTVMPMGDIEDRYLAHYGEPSCVSGTPAA